MSGEKQGVIILYKYAEAIDTLSMESRGMILTAAMEYDRTGKVIEIADPMAKMLFTIMKADLDSLKENWEKRRKANGENGARGGRPRNPNKPSETQENPKKAMGYSENPNKPSENVGLSEETQKSLYDHDHDHDHDHDIDIDIDHEKEKENENTAFSFSPSQKNQIQDPGGEAYQPITDPDGKPVNVAQAWDEIRTEWAKVYKGVHLPTENRLAISLNIEEQEVLRRALVGFRVKGEVGLINAIKNYQWMLAFPQDCRATRSYGGLIGFLKAGPPQFADDKVFNSVIGKKGA